MENNNEGQEVHFIQGNSFTTPNQTLNQRKLAKFMEDNAQRLPFLLQEHKAAENAEVPFLWIAEQHNIKTGVPILSDYVFGTMTVLTELNLQALSADKQYEITPSVQHVIEMLGSSLVLILWNTDDYNNWNHNGPYRGKVKVITPNELLF